MGIYYIYSLIDTDFNKIIFIVFVGLCDLEYFLLMLFMKDEAVVMAYDKLKNRTRALALRSKN